MQHFLRDDKAYWGGLHRESGSSSMTREISSVWLQTRCACTWSRNDAWPRL